MSATAENIIKTETTFTIQAPVTTCYEAWTQKEVIEKWLGDCNELTDANMAITCEIPYLSGNHQIVSQKDNKSIEYKWYINGYPSSVKLTFTDEGDATSIHLLHSIDGKNLPKRDYTLNLAKHRFYIVGGAWEVAIFKLRRCLEGSEGVAISHKQNDQTIRHSIVINTTPEKVWHHLTNADQLKKSAPDFHLEGTKIDPKVGGIYSYGWYPANTPEKDMHDGPSKILVFEENKKLTTNWHGATMSKVTWELSKTEEGNTLLKFTHADLPGYPTEEIWSYRLGWAMHLECTKQFLEKGEVFSDWYKAKR